MKTDEWLKRSTEKLKKAGVPTARLDCLVLLEDELGVGRASILARSDKIGGKSLRKLDKQVAKRAKHIPLAYIRVKTEFYGRDFFINKCVLEPRPESETMIELLKSLKLHDKPVILDLGTGSGALAITAALEIKNSEVIAVDIDQKCLEVAKKNAKKHSANIEILKSNLLSGLKNRKVDVILANLPYVPDKFTLNEAAMNEPKIAIFGGLDGLDVYRKFFTQLGTQNTKPALVLTESLPMQHKELTKIASKAGYKLKKAEDFIQLFTSES